MAQLFDIKKSFIFLFSLLILQQLFCIQKELVRVGYISGYEFISNIDSTTKKGYGYDLLKRMEESSNLQFDFIEVEESAFDAFPSDKIDAIGGVYFLNTAAEIFEYVYPSLSKSKTILGAEFSKDTRNIYYNDPASINGKTIATNMHNIGKRLLDEYLAIHGISVTYLYGEKDNYLRQKADFYINQDNHYDDKEFNAVIDLGDFSSHIVVQKGNVALKTKLENALQNVLEDTAFMTKLQEKYGGLHSFEEKRLLTREEATLLRSKRWRVGYNENYTPYQFTNTAGEADGFTIAVLKRLMQKYGFDVDFIPYNPDEDRLSSLDCDILIAHLGDVDSIDKNFLHTEKYYEYPLVIAYGGEEDLFEMNYEKFLNKVKVGVLNYIALDGTTLSMSFPTLDVVSYSDVDTLFHDFETGTIGAVLLSQKDVDRINFLNKKTGIPTLYPTNITIPLRLYISKGVHPGLENVFNVLIDSMDTRTTDFSYMIETARYISNYSLLGFLHDNAFIILSFIISLIALFALLRIRFLSKTEKTVLKLLNTDDLTPLSSLHCFTTTAESFLVNASPNEYQIISLDMDFFRTVNMYLGTDKGTEVIKTIASSLQESYADTNSLLARVTADQFLVLRKTNEKGLIQLVCLHKIFPALERLLGVNYHFSLSVGTYTIDDVSIPINTLIGRANMARLKGKKTHKTTFFEFDKEMLENYESLTGITQRMAGALEKHEFYPLYQPKVDLHTYSICGAEALVRWKQNDGTVFYPDEFIPLFETNGFIVDLDLYMFKLACDFINENKKLLNIQPISVNFSVKTLEQVQAIQTVIHIATTSEVDLSLLEIEITASALTDSPSSFLTNIELLKRFGFSISIDDFGAGTASLNRLTEFNADVVKLDKVFLDKHKDKQKEYVIVKNVIKMAKDLHMTVLSEGVETAEQAILLKNLGCDIAQGYYFDKPLSKDDFISRLQANHVYIV